MDGRKKSSFFFLTEFTLKIMHIKALARPFANEMKIQRVHYRRFIATLEPHQEGGCQKNQKGKGKKNQTSKNFFPPPSPPTHPYHCPHAHHHQSSSLGSFSRATYRTNAFPLEGGGGGALARCVCVCSEFTTGVTR